MTARKKARLKGSKSQSHAGGMRGVRKKNVKLPPKQAANAKIKRLEAEVARLRKAARREKPVIASVGVRGGLGYAFALAHALRVEAAKKLAPEPVKPAKKPAKKAAKKAAKVPPKRPAAKHKKQPAARKKRTPETKKAAKHKAKPIATGKKLAGSGQKPQKAAQKPASKSKKKESPFDRAARLKEKRALRKAEAVAAAEATVPAVPPLPRREKHQPPFLRDEKGRFAPKDQQGSPEKGWVSIWTPGWQRMDGSTAVAYSSLREHQLALEFIERLQRSGDPAAAEWKRVAKEIAAEVGVHVQEVYTLGMSP